MLPSLSPLSLLLLLAVHVAAPEAEHCSLLLVLAQILIRPESSTPKHNKRFRSLRVFSEKLFMRMFVLGYSRGLGNGFARCSNGAADGGGSCGSPGEDRSSIKPTGIGSLQTSRAL